VFLYPEMSKRITLFSTLMQSLSHHLRPAPYPYGLLTLRLLGKLGGKNRQFLRDPMQLCSVQNLETKLMVSLVYRNVRNENAMNDADETKVLSLPIPLNSCVGTIRDIALTYVFDDISETDEEDLDENSDSRIDRSSLWECKIEEFDIQSYSKGVMNSTKSDLAVASLAVFRAAMEQAFDASTPANVDVETITQDNSLQKLLCTGLLYACMVDSTKEEAITVMQDLVLKLDRYVLSECLASFLSEPSSLATKVGLDFLNFILDLTGSNEEKHILMLFDALICSFCEMSCSCSWGKQSGLRQAIVKMTSTLGSEWSRKYEVNLVSATLLAVKSVPRELSEAAVGALSGFICVCVTLYGELRHQVSDDVNFVWDVLSVIGDTSTRTTLHESFVVKRRPSEDVFKIIIYEMTSPQQLVR
jgi:hypothetical protein